MPREAEEQTPEVNPENPYENDLRGEILKAFDEEAKAEEASPPQPGGEEPPASQPPADGAAPAVITDEKGRVRAPDGKFAKAPEKPAATGGHGASPNAPAGQGGPAGAPTGAPAGQPVQPDLKPPASWRPFAKEAWGNLPPQVRDEVIRREREVASVLNETAEMRKGVQEFMRIVGPYEAMIRSEGSDPLRAVENLLRTAGALRTAPPAQKAALVAQMIQQYGVDVGALDSILAGQGVPQGLPQQAPLDPNLIIEQAKQAALSELMQARQNHIAQNAVSEVESFGANKPFFEDVREDMALALEAAARRGVDMTLEDAYNRAVQMNPEIATIIRQREEAARRQANPTGSTQRARHAATSVRSAPTGPIEKASESRSLREDIEAAMDEG